MKTDRLLIALVLLGTLLLPGCGSRARVGALQTESQSVELGDARSVRVKIVMGAGHLKLSGGAERLLDADFIYNVTQLKPELEYKNDTLVIRQPEGIGLPSLRGSTSFRNEWNLRLNDDVPMELRVEMGAGSSDLHLGSLSLAGLNISLGASDSALVDLSGDLARDLDVTIDAGAGNLSVRLPRNVGVRVKVETGLGTVEAPGLTKDGDVYINAAYGVSDVTLRLDLEAGVGKIRLEVQEKSATISDRAPLTAS